MTCVRCHITHEGGNKGVRKIQISNPEKTRSKNGGEKKISPKNKEWIQFEKILNWILNPNLLVDDEPIELEDRWRKPPPKRKDQLEEEEMIQMEDRWKKPPRVWKAYLFSIWTTRRIWLKSEFKFINILFNTLTLWGFDLPCMKIFLTIDEYPEYHFRSFRSRIVSRMQAK